MLVNTEGNQPPPQDFLHLKLTSYLLLVKTVFRSNILVISALEFSFYSEKNTERTNNQIPAQSVMSFMFLLFVACLAKNQFLKNTGT